MKAHASLCKCVDSPEPLLPAYTKYIQSNLDYLKCQGPQESFRIIGSSNDRNRKFSDIFGKARMLS